MPQGRLVDRRLLLFAQRPGSRPITPVTLTPFKSEALLRLLLADLAGDEVTRDSLATLRDDIADLAPRLRESAAAAEDLPHRRKYLLLVNRFLERLVELHLELVDEVERELRPAGEEASAP